MDLLQHQVKQLVLQLRPLGTISNSYPPTVSSEEKASQVRMTVEAVENLVLHLTRVLSDGLYAGLDLWSVIQTLERIEARAAQRDDTTDVKRLYGFAAQIIFLIKSSMPKASEFIKSKAFFRLALNHGCLIASLELLNEFNEDILTSYMMDHAIIRSHGSPAWDKFVRSVSQVGGVPLEYLLPGVEKPAPILQFQLKHYVPELDEDAERIKNQKQYVSGMTSALPTFSHPAIVIATRVSTPTTANNENPDIAVTQPDDTEGDPSAAPAKRTVIKKTIVKRRVTIVKRVLKSNTGTSVGDESETKSTNQFVGSDNEQDMSFSGLSGAFRQEYEQNTYVDPVMTKRNYVSSETVSLLLDEHKKRSVFLDSAANEFDTSFDTLRQEGSNSGWYFELDENGRNSDQLLRCSIATSGAVDRALLAAEALMRRWRQAMELALEERERTLMSAEDSAFQDVSKK